MKNRGQFLFGALLMLFGLMYLAAIIFDINLRGSVWAILLIGLGLWMLIRPQISQDSRDEFLLFGDVTRSGHWKPQNQTHWMLIGDVKLDLSDIELPEGQTVIRSYALIGDMKVISPKSLPLSVAAWGLINELNFFGQKQDGFLTNNEMQTPAFGGSTRRLSLESTTLIGGVKVREA